MQSASADTWFGAPELELLVTMVYNGGLMCDMFDLMLKVSGQLEWFSTTCPSSKPNFLEMVGLCNGYGRRYRSIALSKPPLSLFGRSHPQSKPSVDARTLRSTWRSSTRPLELRGAGRLDGGFFAVRTAR